MSTVIAEQERRLVDGLLRRRGIDTPTIEQFDEAATIAGAVCRGDIDRAVSTPLAGRTFGRDELEKATIAAAAGRGQTPVRRSSTFLGRESVSVDSTDYPVGEDSIALAAKTEEILRADGRTTWTEEEYFAASLRAAEALGLERMD